MKTLRLLSVLSLISISNLFGQAPVANFTVNKTSGCAPASGFNFNNTSTNNPTTLSWNFGNGQTASGNAPFSSTIQSPIVNYNNPGTYTVTLTATNASGSNTITKTALITVFAPPVADYTISDTTVCAGQLITLTNTSTQGTGSISSYTWVYGDGGSSGSQNPPPISYSAAGTYSLSLTVVDVNTCNSVKVITIDVNKPVADFTSTAPSAGPIYACTPPLPVQFLETATTSGTTTYNWSFIGTGAPNPTTGASPQRTFNNYGIYDVKLVVTDGFGCKDSITKASYVNISEFTAKFDVDTSECQPYNAQFVDGSFSAPAIGNTTIWSWDFGDPGSGADNTSAVQHPTHLYVNAGTYTATLTVTNSIGCVSTTTKTIVVNPKPVASYITDTLQGCSLPFDVNFTSASTGSGYTYQWDIDNNGSLDYTTTNITQLHTYTAEGTYSIRFVVTSDKGCVDDTVSTVSNYVVIEKPNAVFTAIIPYWGCAPLTVDFTQSSTPGIGGPIVKWFYDFGIIPLSADTLSNITGGNVQYTYTTIGEFQPKLVITNLYGCKDSTVFDSVLVGQKPTFDFTAAPREFCHDVSPPVEFQFINLDNPQITDHIIWTYGAPGPPASASINMSGHAPPPPRLVNPLNPNPIHPFSSEVLDTGFIMIQLVAGFNGCYDTLIKPEYLYIHPPAANFTVSDPIICKEEIDIVNFYNTSLARPGTSYIWDMGTDGTNSSGTDQILKNDTSFVTWQYPKAGTYDVYLYAQQTNTGPLSSYVYDGYIFGNTMTCWDSIPKTVTVSHFEAQANYSQTQGCQPLDVAFNFVNFNNAVSPAVPDSNTALITSLVYWNFIDLGNDTLMISSLSGPFFNINYNYQTQGSYLTKMIATNSVGCMDSVEQLIVVDQLPVAQFSASDTFFCAPQTINFNDLSQSFGGANINQWHWDFGTELSSTTGGDTSNVQNPFFLYSLLTPINQPVPITLTVKDNKGCTSPPFTLYVEPSKPFAHYTADSIICSGDSLKLRAKTSGGLAPLQYEWDFGDGSALQTTTIDSISHLYVVNSSTKFGIKLRVIDKNGCDSLFTDSVLVSQPVADFDQSTLDLKCPDIVSFYDLSTSDNDHPVNKWYYSFGDGGFTLRDSTTIPSNADTVTNRYAKRGVYTVQLIVTNSFGCDDTLTKVDLIKVGGPEAKYDYNPKSGCAPIIVTFDVSDTVDVAYYEWSFDDLSGQIDSIKPFNIPFTHQYTSGGVFNPRLAVIDTAGCRIEVTPYPPSIVLTGAVANFTMSDSILCGPTTVNFANTTQPGTPPVNIIKYEWDFGDGSPISTDPNPSHNYSGVDTFMVTLTIYSDTLLNPGCGPYSITKPVYSFIGPPLKELRLTGGNACPPLDVQFFADTTGLQYGITGIRWDFGDNTFDNLQEDPLHTYENSGTYYPTLTLDFSNGCSFTYADSIVFVYPEPTADFTYTPQLTGFLFNKYQFNNISTTPAPSTGFSSQWDFGDGLGYSSIATSPLHVFAAEGTYNVVLKVTNEYTCIDSIIKPIIVDYEPDIPNVFTPNGDGTNDFLDFILPPDAGCMKLEVFNRWGMKVFEQEDYKNDWAGTDMNGKKLNTDTYYYIVTFCNAFTVNGWVYLQN